MHCLQSALTAFWELLSAQGRRALGRPSLSICTSWAAPLPDSSMTSRDWARDWTLRGSTSLGARPPRAAAPLLLPGAAPRRAPDARGPAAGGGGGGARKASGGGARAAGRGRGRGRGRGSSAPRRAACRHRPRAPQSPLERLATGRGRYCCLRAALAAAAAPGARGGQRADPRPWPPGAAQRWDRGGKTAAAGAAGCARPPSSTPPDPARLRTPGSPRAAAEAAKLTAGDGEIAARERLVSTGSGWARRKARGVGAAEPGAQSRGRVAASARRPAGGGGQRSGRLRPGCRGASERSDRERGVGRARSRRSPSTLGPPSAPRGRRLPGCELLPHVGQRVLRPQATWGMRRSLNFYFC